MVAGARMAQQPLPGPGGPRAQRPTSAAQTRDVHSWYRFLLFVISVVPAPLPSCCGMWLLGVLALARDAVSSLALGRPGEEKYYQHLKVSTQPG